LDAALTAFNNEVTLNGVGTKTEGFTQEEFNILKTRANDAKTGVTAATNGDNVPPTGVWVPQADLDALNNAINTAPSSVSDSAYLALLIELTAFNSAKHSGSTPDTAALLAAITSAENAKKDVEIAASKDQATKDSAWVKPPEWDALITPYNAAITARDNAGTTKNAAAEATNALTSAVTAFNAAKTANGPGTKENSPTVSGVTVNPATATVAKGGTRTFTAKVDGDNNPAQAVTWTVVGAADSGTVITTDGGKLTVASGETATTLTVWATSTVDTSKSGMATVTVDTSGTPPALDAYLLGYANVSGKVTPCYWVDGKRILLSLPSTAKGGVARFIAESGSDVYITGVYYDDNDYVMLCYWKNGVLNPLPFTGIEVEATGIAVSGSDVYIAGYYYEDEDSAKPCYWKNGSFNTLSFTGIRGKTTAIAVSGSDVYITGHVQPDDNSYIPCYWKNGTRVALPINVKYGDATGIVVSGSDVYITGHFGDGKYLTPCYWKNGILNTLSVNGTDGYAGGITVSGSDVYITGLYYEDGGPAKPYYSCYWKNGSFNTLPFTGTVGRGTEADVVFVSGNDVYIVGTAYADWEYEEYALCFWVNGQPTTFNAFFGFGIGTGDEVFGFAQR
jgi:hypothetical protein